MNHQCKNEYPVVNGIPVLIHEQESVFSIKDYINGEEKFYDKKTGIKKTAQKIKAILPSLSNNLSSKKNFQLLQKLLAKKT